MIDRHNSIAGGCRCRNAARDRKRWGQGLTFPFEVWKVWPWLMAPNVSVVSGTGKKQYRELGLGTLSDTTQGARWTGRVYVWRGQAIQHMMRAAEDRAGHRDATPTAIRTRAISTSQHRRQTAGQYKDASRIVKDTHRPKRAHKAGN